MYQRANISILLVIFTFFTVFGPEAVVSGKIIYVDEIAGGANNGSSWDDAYNFLQDALADANDSEKPVEIRLAQGSHSPDKDMQNPEGTADRQATFQLINGVVLKGGYAGLGTADPNTRYIELYETALVGDIRQTGFGGGNSYHVVTGSGTDETAVLDGLIIAGGNANGPRLGEGPDYDYRYRYGAGIYNDAGSPTIIECVFIENSAYMCGGGMYNSNGGSPTLTNCIFNWNSSVDGCGIYNLNSNPTLTGCLFSTNIAQNKGGGMYNEQSSPILTDCMFIDNSGSYGGGIYNSQSNPTLTDCSFIANTTLTIRSTDSSLGCGGGMYNDRSSPILSNCIFAENSAYASLSNFGGAMYNNDNSNPVLTDCFFSANWSENYGGGIFNSNSSPTLTYCIFNGNWAEEYGGGMYNKQSNPTLISCLLVWNWAAVVTSYHDSYPSGAGMYNEASSPILSACVLSGNYAEGDGAGMYNSGSSPELANCIIAGNWTADFGGAICNQAGNPMLTNCTFFGNIAYEGNALACDSPQQKSPGNVEITNCILWDGGNEIWNNDDSIITITYSNIRGGFAGRGNIDAEPLFAQAGYWVNFFDPNIIVEPDDPNASWTDGDYHLKSQAGRWDAFGESWVIDDVTSPCIDAGYLNSPVAFEPYPNGGIINMGAYGGTAEASKSPSGIHAKYGGGTGEVNDPYLIYTAEHLNTIGSESNDWDKHFKLMADIDLSAYTGTDFNIIGYWVDLDSPENRPFSGVFDGNGFTISNFTYTSADADQIGLFGYIDGTDAEIKNLGLIDPNIDAGKEGQNVGSLAGYLTEGTITGCYVEGGSISGKDQVGGLVGNHWYGTITNCYSKVSVSGNESVGGLVGLNIGIIKTCYSAGHVEGNVDAGGLVGFGAGVIASFWDVETSGQLISFGGKGRTTAEMQTASTFFGWSFGSVWTIDEGKGYPRLWWEEGRGETPEPQRLSDFLTGAGTENDPYLIYTAEQLNMIGVFPNDWDKHFKLMADIDLAGLTGTDYNFIGIGTDNAFTGVFDGNGKKILNFTYTSTEVMNVGLFAYVNGVSAQIKDLGLIEPNVYTGTEGWSWGVGSLVGWLEEGTITNCYVEGGSVSGNEDVGGLVGSNQDIITNCYAICVVDCNSGGGLVGNNWWLGEITNCYSAGSISGNEWIGGLAGCNVGTITNCYSSGSVTANDIVGGLVGENWGEIIGSFWDTQTSGQLTSDGGTGKTTAQMQTMSTFTNAGWDFVDETANGTEDIWWILEGQDYPRLAWEWTE